MTLQSVLYIVIGLIALFVGGSWLVRGAARLATSLGVPSLIVGMTVVAFGTSAPELLVSISAALAGTPDLALGNVIGSNIANIGLILALAALLAPFVVKWALLEREISVMLVATLITIVFLADGRIDGLDGLGLLVALAGFLLLSYRWLQTDRQQQVILEEVESFEEDIGVMSDKPGKIVRWVEALHVAAGLIGLVVGAQLLVSGATDLARALGIGELVIGLTLVAVGTSLPELVTTVIAARHGENDIAVGNVVGSNIMNLLVILGMTAVMRPIPVQIDLVVIDLLFMVALSAVVPLLLMNKRFGRLEGSLLLSIYVTYLGVMLARNAVHPG